MQNAGDVAAYLSGIGGVRITKTLRCIEQLAGRGQVIFAEAAHPAKLLGVVMHKAKNGCADLAHLHQFFIGIAAQSAAASL